MGFITAPVSHSDLYSHAVNLKDFWAWGSVLSQIYIWNSQWDSKAWLFFSLSSKKISRHSLIPTLGMVTFLSGGCWRGNVLFGNAQEWNAWHSFRIDGTQTSATKKTQLSSPTQTVMLSVFQLQGLVTLPDLSSSPSPKLSSTSSWKTLLHSPVLPNFPFTYALSRSNIFSH